MLQRRSGVVASAAVLPRYAERLGEKHAERGILSTDAPLSSGAAKEALLDV
jgi:3-hydroxyisobutyrate dehydrogenase-like beta-hydroxyacid dehydrogenase